MKAPWLGGGSGERDEDDQHGGSYEKCGGREVSEMRYDPEKGPSDPTRRPETRPGLQKPSDKTEVARKLGETAIKGGQKDKSGK